MVGKTNKRLAKAVSAKVSPLAPERFPEMPPVPGVLLGTRAVGIKYKSRSDLMTASFSSGTQVAGVFTRSKTVSAAVEWCRSKLPNGVARMLVVNSGNANAFTGKRGERGVREIAAAAAEAVNCRQKEVYLASTGVIGEFLDHGKVIGALERSVASAKKNKWEDAARAIMTTDTYPKGATRTADIGGVSVTINGIAKGSGMIEPDMATMLSFIFTDAAIPASVLQTLIIMPVRESFNAITVDSDTSTSDTLLVFATGQTSAYGKISRAGDPRLKDFREKLSEVMLDLAHQVVRDGEGATKFVTIRVTDAASSKSAHRVAKAIANSPLVKTAMAGEDPNWGRIVMAVGKAGEPANRDKLSISIGGYSVAKGGIVDPDYKEPPVARYMKGQEIEIGVGLGVGKASATVWTCDFTHDYIRINADYRS